MQDPLSILQATTSKLAPGGILIWSIPNGYGPCEIEKKIDQRLRLYQSLRFVKNLGRWLTGRAAQMPPSVPYNNECGHVQFFTLARATQARRRCRVQDRADSAMADLSALILPAIRFSEAQRFVEWNVRISDRLPSWMVSNWYFVLAKA